MIGITDMAWYVSQIWHDMYHKYVMICITNMSWYVSQIRHDMYHKYTMICITNTSWYVSQIHDNIQVQVVKLSLPVVCIYLCVKKPDKPSLLLDKTDTLIYMVNTKCYSLSLSLSLSLRMARYKRHSIPDM